MIASHKSVFFPLGGALLQPMEQAAQVRQKGMVRSAKKHVQYFFKFYFRTHKIIA
jgi:hypothetical protein